jgi:hypothetical protein
LPDGTGKAKAQPAPAATEHSMIVHELGEFGGTHAHSPARSLCGAHTSARAHAGTIFSRTSLPYELGTVYSRTTLPFDISLVDGPVLWHTQHSTRAPAHTASIVDGQGWFFRLSPEDPRMIPAGSGGAPIHRADSVANGSAI